MKGYPIAINTIPHSQRYLPHEITTLFHAVRLYRSGYSIRYICRKYHISKSSLMRWNKRFDGSGESLVSRSHRPHSPHPNAHSGEELKWIRDYHRRSPHASVKVFHNLSN
ncbi:MAG: helix-turn-helix domain-containing protein [Eubacterium sp.]|nr:helix-turn-helix domain-containing protein [Eubacterium sp.]MBR0438539.1 helix-turn-helix domain-containing protein [Clostridia bacterium]